jgi:hypothetical protein
MGLFGKLFGTDALKKAGKQMWERGRYMPYGVSTPGYSVGFMNGHANSRLSPEMQGMRNTFMGGFNTGMDRMNTRQNVGGFGAITPEMLGNFNQFSQGMDPTQLQGLGDQFAQGAAMPFDQRYSQLLELMRNSDAFGTGIARQGNIQDQFGKGVLASTAGEYQTRGFEGAMGDLDLQRQLSSFGLAQGESQRQAENAALFNQMAGQRVQDRFMRAMDLFGMGEDINASQQAMGFNQAQLGAGGVQGMDQFLASLIGLGGDLGSQQSAANIGANQGNLQAAQAHAGAMSSLFGNVLGGIAGGMGGGGGFMSSIFRPRAGSTTGGGAAGPRI